jgi:Domain of unknown function (DUF3883)
MATIRQILWRQVTDSDFVCVERSKENTPAGGGGQTYFSLGTRLSRAGLGGFLGFDPPERINTEHSPVGIDVAVLGESTRKELIEFRPRYQNGSDTRYCIARQNRQRSDQIRHPAWTAARGFPAAPDDIADKADPRMPDLSQLKLIIARCDDGTYLADYVNADQVPDGAPPELAVLFKPNRTPRKDGLIDLNDGDLSARRLGAIIRRAQGRPRGDRPTSPEIEDALDATARSAGAHSRRGQGFRQSAQERAAIDRHAMLRATAVLEADSWTVEDRSINHSYDLFCQRGGKKLHVEVKGTTGDGSAVLLTPNEVEFARNAFPEMALLIVHGVELAIDEHGEPKASGGEIELEVPWEIDAGGTLKPTGFIYDREQ